MNLLCVNLIGSKIHEDLAKKFWLEVEVQISLLERNFGEVRKIYREANYLDGEAGLKNLQAIDAKEYQFIKGKFEKGATLKALEDKEILLELTDFQLFLTIRSSGKEVLERCAFPSSFQKVSAVGETGILLMRKEEGMRIQFPPEINVILVRPPVSSEMEKWEFEHRNQSGK